MTNTETAEHRERSAAVKITIERFKLAPSPVRSYRVSWKWTYDYRVDGGPICQYGPGLADLRQMLKRKFPQAKIVEGWKA